MLHVSLSFSGCQVIICGRQVMCSFLSQSIELKLVQHHSVQDGQVALRERVARLEADSKLPSFVLEDAELTQLCVRACGDDAWSQDVCVEHKNNSSVLQVHTCEENIHLSICVAFI